VDFALANKCSQSPPKIKKLLTHCRLMKGSEHPGGTNCGSQQVLDYQWLLHLGFWEHTGMHQERFCKTQHVSWSFSFVSPFSSSSSSILGVFNKNADLIKKIMCASTSIRIGATNVQTLDVCPTFWADYYSICIYTHCQELMQLV
jgi:hypothetical protein